MDLSLLLKELDRWGLPADESAITTSGVLAALGIREANDLDVIVTHRLWNELAHRYPFVDGKIRLGDHVEIMGPDSPLSVDSNARIEASTVIEGHRFVQVEDVRRVKVALGRPKDLRDVELIDEFVKRNG